MNGSMRLRGFVMSEVLVALVVLAVAVSGVLALALRGLSATAEARRAELAAVLAADLAGRVRALPDASWAALAAPAPCEPACTPGQLAAREWADWRETAEALLPGAVTFLEPAAPSGWVLSLEWPETGGERRLLRLGIAP
jgi:Tfp pilus assembly protein PilV